MRNQELEEDLEKVEGSQEGLKEAKGEGLEAKEDLKGLEEKVEKAEEVEEMEEV